MRPPTEITSSMRNAYLSRQRAANVLLTLGKIRDAMGVAETAFGPGYRYLQSVAGTLRDYGGTDVSPQTRQQYLQYQAALDPLLAEGKGEALAAYGPASRMLSQPFFSAGQLRTAARDEFGNWRFGTANRRLFG